MLSFNPCFLGTCPRSLSRACGSFHIMGFQSLFSWNLPSKIRLDAVFHSALHGFNPCFLGTCPRSKICKMHVPVVLLFQSLFSWNLPSKPSCEVAIGIWHEMFQSLFSWNLPSKAIYCAGLTVNSSVSILVFLELALEVEFAFTIQDFHFVSILVFLELALEAAKEGREQKKPSWFQSLFSWNLPSKLTLGDRISFLIYVSILVFLELALEVSVPIITACSSWGFNPCFLGTCPRSHYFISFYSHFLMFQSLFSWNLPSKIWKLRI